MNWRLRPRFRLQVRLPADEVVDRFADVDTTDGPFELYVEDRQAELTVSADDRHFWSPYLKLRIDPEDGETELRGTFGPNINVWSMFVAAYAVSALVGTTGLFVAFSQVWIDQSPTGLGLTALSVVATLLVWVAGQIGQRLAYDQMIALHLLVHHQFQDVLAAPPRCEACADDDSIPTAVDPP